MFKTGEEIIRTAYERNARICDLIMQDEMKNSELSLEKVREKMSDNLSVMKKSSSYGIENEIKSVSGLTGGDAKRVDGYRGLGKTLSGDILNKAMARALSCSEVNAAMGKIVAAPTAGSCGILPAVLITSGEILELNDEDLIDGLFTAAGIGQIIARNATLSGAEGGCQAECGSASAMAAAAVVETAGGSPRMALNAAAMALQNVMGLVCDPVAGLVELPCARRNASGAVNAMITADMALAGVNSIIPFDEVVDAMYRVGRALPESLRETALGGIATTPTALGIVKQIYK
jgi:L-serine dehydratase